MTDARCSSFKKWVFGAGLFKVIIGFPVALPFLYEQYYKLFDALNSALGLGGAPLVPPAEPANLFLIHIAGMEVCLVGIILLYASRNLRDRMAIPLSNALVHGLFVFLVLYYVMARGVARILLSFAVVDAVLSIVFLYYIFALRERKG
jgi:hypothetical protein